MKSFMHHSEVSSLWTSCEHQGLSLFSLQFHESVHAWDPPFRPARHNTVDLSKIADAKFCSRVWYAL